MSKEIWQEQCAVTPTIRGRFGVALFLAFMMMLAEGTMQDGKGFRSRKSTKPTRDC